MIHEAEESLDNLLSPNGPLAGVIKITDFPLANGKTIMTTSGVSGLLFQLTIHHLLMMKS